MRSLNILIVACCILLLYSCKRKNYNVEIQDGQIYVTMHCPTMGIVGINQVSFDGFTYEEVEKEVFDEIRGRSYDGLYTITVIIQFLDKYGNYYNGTPIQVTTLSASEVKKYASYNFFRGQTYIEKSFPWNRVEKKQNSTIYPTTSLETAHTTASSNLSLSNNSSYNAHQEDNIQGFDYTGNWECPNLYEGGMNVCLTLIHNPTTNNVKIDYLINYRIANYENATGWVDNNTLHIAQAPDEDGNYIYITAYPVNKNTIKGVLKYKNTYDSYNGKLIMNRK